MTRRFYKPERPDTYYRTGRYKIDHSTYGGEISLFDFEGHHTLTSMAKKIRQADLFTKQLAIYNNFNFQNKKNRK